MSKRKGLIYGMCILEYVVELTSIFQPSRKRATISSTKLSVVNIPSSCEQLEEDHLLIRGTITQHTYMTLLSVGSIIRKGVTNTTNKHHQASPMRGLFYCQDKLYCPAWLLVGMIEKSSVSRRFAILFVLRKLNGFWYRPSFKTENRPYFELVFLFVVMLGWFSGYLTWRYYSWHLKSYSVFKLIKYNEPWSPEKFSHSH